MDTTAFEFIGKEVAGSLAGAILDKHCSRPIKVPTDAGSSGYFVRCGSRLSSSCRSCSKIYRGDWSAILRSGIFPDGSLEPENYINTRFQFLTLTAPSFGRVHGTEALKGVPIGAYDYDGAVAWNHWVSKLWDHTRLRLRRLMPNLDYAVVREWQARGALHLHVLLRVPSAEAQLDELVELVSQATQTEVKTTSGESVIMTWGTQVKCETLRPQNGDAVETARTVGYLAKALSYSAKSFSDSLVAQGRSINPLYAAHVARLDNAARRMRCSQCGWLPGYKCKGMAHRQFGARASLVSVSRTTSERAGWSLTGLSRQSQKEARVAWAKDDGSSAGIPQSELTATGWAINTIASLESPPLDDGGSQSSGDAASYSLGRYKRRWQKHELELGQRRRVSDGSIADQLSVIMWDANSFRPPDEVLRFVLLEDLDALLTGDQSVALLPLDGPPGLIDPEDSNTA